MLKDYRGVADWADTVHSIFRHQLQMPFPEVSRSFVDRVEVPA